MLHENTVKIATATMSREIFLAVGNTGFFNPSPSLRTKCTPSACGSSPGGGAKSFACSVISTFGG